MIKLLSTRPPSMTCDNAVERQLGQTLSDLGYHGSATLTEEEARRLVADLRASKKHEASMRALKEISKPERRHWLFWWLQ